jgi:hypothetical protein
VERTFLAAKVVVNRILQDTLEEHRQFVGRLFRIFLRQLEHRILDDVVRRMLVTDREHRLFECAPLDFREKHRNFLVSGQKRSIQWESPHYRMRCRMDRCAPQPHLTRASAAGKV